MPETLTPPGGEIPPPPIIPPIPPLSPRNPFDLPPPNPGEVRPTPIGDVIPPPPTPMDRVAQGPTRLEALPRDAVNMSSIAYNGLREIITNKTTGWWAERRLKSARSDLTAAHDRLTDHMSTPPPPPTRLHANGHVAGSKKAAKHIEARRRAAVRRAQLTRSNKAHGDMPNPQINGRNGRRTREALSIQREQVEADFLHGAIDAAERASRLSDIQLYPTTATIERQINDDFTNGLIDTEIRDARLLLARERPIGGLAASQKYGIKNVRRAERRVRRTAPPPAGSIPNPADQHRARGHELFNDFIDATHKVSQRQDKANNIYYRRQWDRDDVRSWSQHKLAQSRLAQLDQRIYTADADRQDLTAEARHLETVAGIINETDPEAAAQKTIQAKIKQRQADYKSDKNAHLRSVKAALEAGDRPRKKRVKRAAKAVKHAAGLSVLHAKVAGQKLKRWNNRQPKQPRDPNILNSL